MEKVDRHKKNVHLGSVAVTTRSVRAVAFNSPAAVALRGKALRARTPDSMQWTDFLLYRL